MAEAQYRIAYTVRRSDRARHARIVVDASGVEVVIPRRMALRHVEPFVQEKRGWIEHTLRRIQTAEANAGIRLEDGGTVPYLGRELALRVRGEPGRGCPHGAPRPRAEGCRAGRWRRDAGRGGRCAPRAGCGPDGVDGPRLRLASTPPAR